MTYRPAAQAGRFACALDDILEANQAALAFSRSRLLARAA